MIAFLARIIGVPPIAIEAVIVALLILAGGAGYLKIYDKGYSAAESKCEAAALQSKLDAMQKDRDDARAAAADASLKLAAIEVQTKDEHERTADYVAELEKRPAPSCALTCDDLRGLRIASKSCPPVPRSSGRAGVHGAGPGPVGPPK